MNSWIYNNQLFEDTPSDYVGFVYIIECIPTSQKYIGRKIFLSAKKKAPLKGKTRARHSKVDSNWREYYGSSDYIKQLVKIHGKDNFRREIVRLCYSKSEMSYYEAKLIFETDALIKDVYLNRWLTLQINSKNLEYLKCKPEIVNRILEVTNSEPDITFNNNEDMMEWLNE